MNWILVLIIATQTGNFKHMQTIDGFDFQSSCIEAGEQISKAGNGMKDVIAYACVEKEPSRSHAWGPDNNAAI